MGWSTKSPLLHLPTPLMYPIPYATRGSQAAFTRVGRSAVSQGLHLGTHCLVCALFTGVRLPTILYVFCHTLEEFSIRSACDFSAPKKKERDRMERFLSLRTAVPFHTNMVYRMSHMQTMGRHCAVADKGLSQTV